MRNYFKSFTGQLSASNLQQQTFGFGAPDPVDTRRAYERTLCVPLHVPVIGEMQE